MRKKNKILFCLFSFLFALSAFSSLVWAQEKIIAVVNNEIITQRDLESFINFMQVQLSKQYSPQELDKKIAVMRADLLDRLIEDKLILQEAKKNNLQVDEARIRSKIDDLKKRYNSEIEFEDSLRKQGLVEADIQQKIRDQILMYNIVETKIRDKIVIKPAEITEFYNKNISDFSLSEEREFQLLSGLQQDKVQKAVLDLRQGKDLPEAARENGLVLNTLKARPGGELKKDVEDVLFNLKVGEVSEPVKIKDSYYVFKLNAIKPPRKQTLGEAQSAIHGILYENKMQEAEIKWVDELRKKAYIKKL